MLTPEQTRLRESRTEIVAVLRDLGARFRGESNTCTCPFHDDKQASAGVFRGDDTSWHFRCHGCDVHGDIFDLRARREGRNTADVLREARGAAESGNAPPKTEKPSKIFPTLEALHSSLASCVAAYRYTHPQTRSVELAIFRLEPPNAGKRFIQASPVAGGFVMRAPEGLLPIYNRTRVAAASEVVMVEGEKCVHALAAIDITATTTPGGAGKSAKCDLSPLAGKTVYLFPDNDAPDDSGKTKGTEHMREIARTLETLEPKCRLFWIDVTALDLPVKGDVVDYLARNGGSRDDKRIAVKLLLEEATPLGASAGLQERLHGIIDGTYRSIDFEFLPLLTRLTKALLPGTITVLPGDPGSSKSFFILQAAWQWHIAGVRSCVFMLEEDRTYHLHRALAQIEGNAELADDEWVKANPALALAAYDGNKDLLDDFGRNIFEAPDKQVSLDWLSEWVERQARAGFEIIGIDPITAAAVSDKPWIDDHRFILTAKATMRRYGSRLLLVTHPRKDRGKLKGTSLSDMAGGVAYERFSQSVIWLHRPEKIQTSAIVTQHGNLSRVSYNRSLQIRKARNGAGVGSEIAYIFDPRSLRFAEQGVVFDETENDVPRNLSPAPQQRYEAAGDEGSYDF